MWRVWDGLLNEIIIESDKWRKRYTVVSPSTCRRHTRGPSWGDMTTIPVEWTLSSCLAFTMWGKAPIYVLSNRQQAIVHTLFSHQSANINCTKFQPRVQQCHGRTYCAHFAPYKMYVPHAGQVQSYAKRCNATQATVEPRCHFKRIDSTITCVPTRPPISFTISQGSTFCKRVKGVFRRQLAPFRTVPEL